MTQSTKQVKVENLNHNDVIIDPEGNEARVIRVRRIDHLRAKLETDIGARIVNLADKFPVLP
ncbi:hypothetical protein SEA_CAPTAINREX_27 [Microbacterium phage CaptainRex]|nr:hypothetical protein SEA_LIBRIE_27 [Microbacterium phage Librie]WIC89858.1 hypothetical protein SEA_CAPTAINREX_27 [Microbacterium phage CaptainRex]